MISCENTQAIIELLQRLTFELDDLEWAFGASGFMKDTHEITDFQAKVLVWTREWIMKGIEHVT